jgi:hypothetical protein
MRLSYVSKNALTILDLIVNTFGRVFEGNNFPYNHLRIFYVHLKCVSKIWNDPKKNWSAIWYLYVRQLLVQSNNQNKANI